MSSVRSARKGAGRALLAAAVLVATAQCTKLPYEPVQILVLEVETAGSEIDTDGYIASIDDEMSQPVEVNGSATFEGLGAGPRMLTLSGLAGNCAVDGPNPRVLSIDEDAITRARVTVTCNPVAGLLVVEAATTGSDQDPDGYTVSVDDSTTRTIGTTGSVTFEGLTPGDHVVTLANVAENCGLVDEEPNPRVVTLTADASTTTTFRVQCGPRGGDLVVVAATTGTDVDPDGYTITLDEGDPTPIGTNGALTFTNLADGEHRVTIDGLANNCSLTEGSPSRIVTVTSSASAAETFFVFCGPPAGALVVDVTTTGTDVDDGYLVSVTQALTGQILTKSLTTNGSATFEGLAEGEYEVVLTGVAGNCSVVVDETENPRTLVLTAGASSSTSFFVHCQPVAGALVVDVSTRGAPDSEGYAISVEGAATKGVGPNGAVLFEELLAGPWDLEVTGIPDSCALEGANPRTDTILPGASTRVSLEVLCGTDEPPGGIRVEVTTTGEAPDPDGYELVLDAGSPERIAANGERTYLGLAPGPHSVAIGDLAENCSLSGTRVRDVTVEAEGLVVVRFAVSCPRTTGGGGGGGGTGRLEVKPRTTGDGPYPEGYTIAVDSVLIGSVVGPDERFVPPNRVEVFEAVLAGERTVTIDNFAPECLLKGAPTESVTVAAGGVTVFWFRLECRR